MAAPVITTLTPASGYQDKTTLVTITGTDLASVTQLVIGSTGMNIVSNSATVVTAYIPKFYALGAATVTLTTAGGSDTETFTVLAQPFISVDPSSKFGSYKDQYGRPAQVQLTSTGAIPVDTELTFSGDVMVEDVVVRGNTVVDGSGTDTCLLTDASGHLQIDTLSIVPGVGATNLGKAEDAAHTSADVGVMALAVRADTAAATGANSDYVPLLTDANGRLHCLDANSATIAGDTTSIDGKIPAKGTAIMTGAVPITIATDDTMMTALDTAVDIIAGDTTSIDGKITACNTGAVVVASGAITETNSGTIAGDTTSIDGKITACNTGAVVISSGTCAVTNAGTFAVQAAPNRTVAVTSATGSAGISTTTAIAAKFRLSSITLHANAAMASEALTITVDANDGADYDAVLYSVNTSGVTDICYTPDNDLLFESGDEIVVTCTNTNTATYGLRIVTEVI